MPRTIVPAEGGALPAGRLFIEVTPAMRRALELLADATILVLDEIDGDVDVEEVNEDGTELDLGEGGDVLDTGEPTLGWTEREARTGSYGRNALDDDEPTYGSIESYPSGANLTSPYYYSDATSRPGIGDQTNWGRGPTPLKLDELEPVCEGEGECCEDEGGEHDGREPDDGH